MLPHDVYFWSTGQEWHAHASHHNVETTPAWKKDDEKETRHAAYSEGMFKTSLGEKIHPQSFVPGVPDFWRISRGPEHCRWPLRSRFGMWCSDLSNQIDARLKMEIEARGEAPTHRFFVNLVHNARHVSRFAAVATSVFLIVLARRSDGSRKRLCLLKERLTPQSPNTQ